MSLSDNDLACPVCGRPMRLLTIIRRVPGEQTLVLQCRPCGLSTTNTVDAPKLGETTHGQRRPTARRRHNMSLEAPSSQSAARRGRHHLPRGQT
jgi:C4-type Zn-finger protein